MKTLISLFCFSSLFMVTASQPSPLNPTLHAYVQARGTEFDQISPARREELKPLSDYIHQQTVAGKPIQVLFVCTHNSRRSQMSQAWAQALAAHLGIARMKAQSAGLEQTAFNARAVDALKRAGFTATAQDSKKPDGLHYTLTYGTQGEHLAHMHSKTLESLRGEWKDFAAVMTCAEADGQCPYVPGATARIKLTYEDPKVADGTPQEAALYDERCAQIARELLWALTQAQATAQH